MAIDITGNPINQEPQPPHGGVCPNCGGTITTDIVSDWMCHDCGMPFPDGD